MEVWEKLTVFGGQKVGPQVFALDSKDAGQLGGWVRRLSDLIRKPFKH